MKRVSVACVFGTRPDAVKMAPVIKELERHPDQIRIIRISTGQHKEMLEQVLRVFDVTPDYDLQLMTDRQTLTDLTTRALGALVPVLEAEKPDLVILDIMLPGQNGLDVCRKMKNHPELKNIPVRMILYKY